MRKRQKSDVEKLLAREFLENELCLPIHELRGQEPTQPDVYAVVNRDGRAAILEIELTEYHVDTSTDQKGGSPGAGLHSFWQKVQEYLRQQLTRDPIERHVLVTLKDPTEFPNGKAQAFAEELVRLARRFEFPSGMNIADFDLMRGVMRFARGFEYRYSEPEPLPSFEPTYPLMGQCVGELQLWKVNHYSILWSCTNASAANVGLRPDHVAALIGKKAQKTYTWAGNSEKWLLVYAQGPRI